MAHDTLTGTRIRQRRFIIGPRQANPGAYGPYSGLVPPSDRTQSPPSRRQIAAGHRPGSGNRTLVVEQGGRGRLARDAARDGQRKSAFRGWTRSRWKDLCVSAWCSVQASIWPFCPVRWPYPALQRAKRFWWSGYAIAGVCGAGSARLPPAPIERLVLASPKYRAVRHRGISIAQSRKRGLVFSLPPCCSRARKDR